MHNAVKLIARSITVSLAKSSHWNFSICFASECLSHGNGVDSEGLLQLLSLLKRSLIGTDWKQPLTDGEGSIQLQAAISIVATAARLVICSHPAAPFSYSEVVCVWVGGWVVGWVYVGVYLCMHVTFLTDMVCVCHIMPLSSLLLVCSQHALLGNPLLR